MDPATIAVPVATAAGAVSAVPQAWVRSRAQRPKVREVSRRDHVRRLPPGSQVIDLGDRGVTIEIGNSERERPADGHE
jgi:hypothetical protein